MVLDLPGVVDAQAIGQLDLVQGLLEEDELAVRFPWPGELMLVEDAELHGSPFPGSECVIEDARS
jgi:hypothetical protein